MSGGELDWGGRRAGLQVLFVGPMRAVGTFGKCGLRFVREVIARVTRKGNNLSAVNSRSLNIRLRLH